MIGRVRLWNRDRSYGLIEGEDGGVYFVHREQVVYQADLRRGQRVGFEPAASPRGPRANAVQVLQPAEDRGEAARPGR